jgi:hypothetical protein
MEIYEFFPNLCLLRRKIEKILFWNKKLGADMFCRSNCRLVNQNISRKQSRKTRCTLRGSYLEVDNLSADICSISLEKNTCFLTKILFFWEGILYRERLLTRNSFSWLDVYKEQKKAPMFLSSSTQCDPLAQPFSYVQIGI